MALNDIIAAYGAIVASIVALIQIRNHQAANKLLQIWPNPEFSLANGYVNLTLTNLSDRELDLEFVGVGVGFRSWLRPWRYQIDDAWGLYIYVVQGSRDVQWLDPLKPGQMVYAELTERSYLPKGFGIFGKKGFAQKVCVTITHSMSSRDLIQVLR